MSKYTGEAAFSKANQWYKENGETLIPKRNFPSLFSNATVEINAGQPGSASYGNELSMPRNCIPLVSASIAGLSPGFLAKVAEHHGVADSLYDLVEGFGECNFKDVYLASGETVNAYDVLKPCLYAVEAVDENAFSRAYRRTEANDSGVTLAMASASSAQQWPSTQLALHQKVFEGENARLDKPLTAVTHNCLNLNRTRGMPSDSTGFRCDWLLERSGMLLPGVIRKNLGRFTLWEEFFGIIANYYDAEPVQRMFDYCLNAPLAIRPAIFNGLQSMMAEGPKVSVNSQAFREAIRQKFTDTWLSPLLDSIVLQANMIGIGASSVAETMRNPQYYPAVFRQPQLVTAHLYKEISEVLPHELGLAQFAALRFPERQDIHLPKQVIDPAMDREGLIRNLLEGLQTFRGNPTNHTQEQRAIQDIATEGVNTVIKTLAPLGEFDYSRFQGLSSSSARLLAMAGLDPKRLPAMNNRDKGRVLEDGLGF
jgi:hypothetical protein